MTDNDQKDARNAGTVQQRLQDADRLRMSGQLEAAAGLCRKILADCPGHADTLNYLGLLEFHRGYTAEATRLIREAIDNTPANSAYHGNLANIYYRLRRFNEAKKSFQDALALNPADLTARTNYAWLLGEEGNVDAAADGYRQVLSQREVPGIRARLAMLVPPVFMSNEEIATARSVFRENICELISSDIRLQDPYSEVGSTNFFLAYHGKCNRELQSLVAEFYIKSCPGLLYSAPHCLPGAYRHTGRIRIGFISEYFHDHSIGRTTQGLIAQLDRTRFEVVVFSTSPPRDELGAFIQSNADDYRILPRSLSHAREMISSCRLDILLYPDIGMESFTYFLAYSRLAPIQCTSFGHPDTTGIPNLDYFISTDCYETEDGDSHYSEQLVRLRGIASLAYYDKPAMPGVIKSRDAYDLQDSENVYVCPQHLFKLHPDFDAMLAGILRKDPGGRVVLIQGQHRLWDRMLTDRFRKAMPDVCDRIIFLPRQSHADFINLIAVSDVMLDTVHFCGQNTTHECLAAGTPVVTLPGDLHRSRHTMCFLKRVGLESCIAGSVAEYVDIATRLANDMEFRKQVRQLIKENAPAVWNEREVVAEHERLFTELVAGLPQGDMQ